MHGPNDPRDEKTLGETLGETRLPKEWVTPTLSVLPVPTATRGGAFHHASSDGPTYHIS
jgi:hypothetical protein